ncbi:XRE family transcriptional regulator [Christensenella tenuis]|uniref:Helix-turn-helix domain-containing protein n=1 Tax=Christensenella tenuis TaxID=2763033 RepID=A0ABR7ECN6_9FIRM|nr:XRE family transcriptional regulator [Christensenella tenuis]MBC5647537.1 helix-turn-helix domain-containing protein [Christensenella tenuis]
MKTFAKRLNKALERANITPAELSRITNIPEGTISHYRSGKYMPKQFRLSIMAKALHTTQAYLLGWEDEDGTADLVLGEIDHSKRTGAPIDTELKNAERIATEGWRNLNETICRPYPIIGEVTAGFGSEAVEEETGDYEQIPIEWLRGHNPDNFFVLRVKGDSMYPKFIAGDRVLVHRKTTVDSGSIAVVLYDGNVATVKQVKYVNGEDWVDLIPINPEFQTKRVAGVDLEQCRVLGEVKRLIRIIK